MSWTRYGFVVRHEACFVSASPLRPAQLLPRPPPTRSSAPAPAPADPRHGAPGYDPLRVPPRMGPRMPGVAGPGGDFGGDLMPGAYGYRCWWAGFRGVLMSGWCKQVAHCIQACPHTGAARWVLTTRCSVAEAALECPVLAACHLECHLEHDSTRSMGREVYRPCQTCHSLVRVVLAGVVAGVVGGGEDADSTASLTLTTSSRHRMGCTSRLYF